MVGWRTKFVFMLIIYSAGFATAIYLTAPPPNEGGASQSPKNRLSGTVDSRKLAVAMNTGIHKVADLSKELAIRATALIKQQVKEAQARKKGDESQLAPIKKPKRAAYGRPLLAPSAFSTSLIRDLASRQTSTVPPKHLIPK